MGCRVGAHVGAAHRDRAAIDVDEDMADARVAGPARPELPRQRGSEAVTVVLAGEDGIDVDAEEIDQQPADEGAVRVGVGVGVVVRQGARRQAALRAEAGEVGVVEHDGAHARVPRQQPALAIRARRRGEFGLAVAEHDDRVAGRLGAADSAARRSTRARRAQCRQAITALTP